MKKLLLGLIWLATATAVGEVVNIYRADVFFSRGAALQQLDYPDESYQQLKKATALNPREPTYFKKLAQATTTLAQEENSQKRLQEAAAYAQKAFHLNPANLLTLKSLTLTYLEAARLSPTFLEKAEAVAQLAISLCPTDPQLHYNLAVIYWSEEKHPEALEAVNRALELKTDYGEAQTLKELLFQERRRPLRFGGDEADTTVRAEGAYKAKQSTTGSARGNLLLKAAATHSLQAQSFSRR
ncbi:hypothetical protein L6258_01875 [Candidatus Parcubacteria bacterium]|nr:hypothetical protein [Candidatus Parcubacteria bacterium]